MKLEETAKYLKRVKNMNRTTKNNSRPEGSICEQSAYLPKLVVYTNSSDMNVSCNRVSAELNPKDLLPTKIN